MAYSARKIKFFEDYQNHKDFDKILNSLEKEEWLSKHTFKDEKELYHYSNLNGIRGIIENRELWFSHISSLNDPMEIDHGRK
ncbi:MAG: hypothetical protein WD053_11725 [Gracilimonas sp.]